MEICNTSTITPRSIVVRPKSTKHRSKTMPLATTFPFNPATDIPSLAGKVILITGVKAGLGKRTALELV